MVIGVRPSTFAQFWEWVRRYMPQNKNIHFKTRNAVCFEKKQIKSPTEVICLASSFISYWAGLQKQDDKQNMEAGAEAMKGGGAALLSS
uniref:Uncharacterized protein n=1 Tax=Setaria viridis TaxID=4556 RepID=A0A4U6UGV0_SETVI|nr:hypothetical protein SEVIR_5G231500v2 [Setaria viridis]